MAEYVEVLREVAGIVNSLAAHGKDAFIWWLVTDFAGKVVPPVAALLGWVSCVWIVARGAGKIVSSMRFSDEYVLHIRDMAAPERAGAGAVSDSDKSKLREFAAIMQGALIEKRADAVTVADNANK